MAAEHLPLIFFVLLFAVAFLYASVGHGGASGYLALMSFFAFAPESMRSSALLLNLLVSALAFVQYYRAGHFSWHLFWPFACTSVPAALIGSLIVVDAEVYKKVLGILLLFSIVKISGVDWKLKTELKRSTALMLLVGGIIGFLSGLIGIGGGILLSPLILLFGWATIKETAAVSALFIFVNSLAGFVGLFSRGFAPTPVFYTMVLLAFAGGLLGAYLGAAKLHNRGLRLMLAAGLLLASLKLLLT